MMLHQHKILGMKCIKADVYLVLFWFALTKIYHVLDRVFDGTYIR